MWTCQIRLCTILYHSNLCNCIRNLQCMNPRPRARIQLNRYVAKALTIAADHTGFQFAEAIVWACAALRKLSCNSRQHAPQHQEAGEFFSVHWSSTALFTLVCVQYGMTRHNKDLLSANSSSQCTWVHLLTMHNFATMRMRGMTSRCDMLESGWHYWHEKTTALIPGCYPTAPMWTSVSCRSKKGVPTPLVLHSKGPGFFQPRFSLESSSNSPRRVVSVASWHSAYPPPLSGSCLPSPAKE